MTKTFNAVEFIETIDLLKLITKDEYEALDVFKNNQMNELHVKIEVEDVIFGLCEFHQALYKHDTTKINNKNLKEIKEYYYAKGYQELEEDSFINGVNLMYDILCGNDDMEHVKEIALAAFGSSFTYLYTTKAMVRSELSNFIQDIKFINQYIKAFEELDDLNYLMTMCDEYTLRLLTIHQYYYNYNDSQLTTISGDAIGILCELYYDNRSKVDWLGRYEFMSAIDYLLEIIDKERKTRSEIINIIDTLFDSGEDDDCNYFEGLTDYAGQSNDDIDSLIDRLRQLKNGKSITLTPDDSFLLNDALLLQQNKAEKDYDELKDEYFDFIDDVDKFRLELEDLCAHGYNIDTPEQDLLHKISDLFDKNVKF